LGTGCQQGDAVPACRYLQVSRHCRSTPAKSYGQKGRELGSPGEAEEVIERAIREVYLKPTRPTLSHLVSNIHERCSKEGIELPDRRTVRARIKAIDIRVRGQRRGEEDVVKGTNAAPGEYSVSRPLEVVQIDHTEIDIIVVDERTRSPMPNRPWLTLAIDVFSRVVTGFHVSMNAPSRVGGPMTVEFRFR
jgi:putative transposase